MILNVWLLFLSVKHIKTPFQDILKQLNEMADFLKVLLIFLFIKISNGFNCYLPEKCELERISSVETDSNQKENWKPETIIMCAIRDDTFEFQYKESTPQFNTSETCLLNKKSDHIYPSIIFRWTSTNILENRLKLTNTLKYINHFYIESYFIVKFWDIKGFDVNLIDFVDYNYNQFSYMIMLELTNVRVEFYRNRKRLSSCQDFIIDNQTRIESIFQIKTAFGIIGTHFKLKYIEYKNKICPLVFTNANIYFFSLFDLMETFYKKSILSFTNESFPDLKSFIVGVIIDNVQNINIDSNLLHPSVFKYTSEISIFSGSLNSIDGEIFKNLNKLFRVFIQPFIFRKINHKQGLEWIKKWNNGKSVNLSKITVTVAQKEIVLKGVNGKPLERLPKIFPDEDFCLYIDFPFNQLVILYEEIYIGNAFFIMDNDFTCTYSWLVQYYDSYYNYYLKVNADVYYKQLQRLNVVLRSVGFNYLRCNFTEKIRLCNRSNYQPKDDWDKNDFFILNKRLQTVFKISLYPISFLGLVTNFIVVFVILKKENSDLFKEFKQYTYLYLNSIFCIVISLIELISWMTECFYPFEVFCPEIHKLVAIQFFKIIFKECFVTLLRFMLSFTYFAFALNRIGLIGKDHGKLVTFISEVGIKKYIGVSLLISSSLSWIKYFKYEVNYFVSYMSFPISNENNIMNYESNSFNNFYFIYNSISDLVNYLVFVVICAIIDICMVVQLRRTLAEQEKKRESMNQQKKQSSESEEAVNKAIKMVVLNSLIGIFFKIPVCIIPLINVYAEFYYKNYLVSFKLRLTSYQINHPRFGEFYSMFKDTGFYELIQDLSYSLFTLSLAIQIFIYNHFDKKFRTAFDRIKENVYIKKTTS